MSTTVFPTAFKEPRPVRLSEATRDWAMRSLMGEYGDEAEANGSVPLDGEPGFEELSLTGKYDLAVRRIAERAPIRICPEERLAGAATLGGAIRHVVPATYTGETFMPSVSHLTIRYDRVIREGVDSYSREIAERLRDPALTDGQREFLRSLENTVASMKIWHERYLAATKDTRPDLYETLLRVPFSPARNFREALQALWFTFAFTRLTGNWPGIGRIDALLGDYLERDLKSGAVTLDEARELMASFFIKGCEWIRSSDTIGTLRSGDAQHYQNIVLAGVDENGREVTNAVTYLVLDTVEELSISDYPITVRLREDSPALLKTRVAEVMRHGGGTVAVYNESLVLRALSGIGYPTEAARRFANDGCWEVQIPGETDFSYLPFDSLQLFNRALCLDGEGEPPDYPDIEALYAAFREELRREVGQLYSGAVEKAFTRDEAGWRSSWEVHPTSVVSLFEDGCVEHARSYHDAGPRYIVRSPHIGGAPDVANSLWAIENLVYKEKRVTLRELVLLLRGNWEGDEALRLYAKNRYTYYGNDSEGADGWHARILSDFADAVDEKNAGSPLVKFIPGVSTFGRQIDWLPARCATAFGAKKGDILSGNDSPTPGTDFEGATSVIRSYCKADLARMSNGAALDVKLSPDSLAGYNGTDALVGLIDGFLRLGGYFMQLDVVDVATLRAAKECPEDYRTLSVRVSGWNARFVTLNDEWQNMVIERAAGGGA